MRVPNLYFGKYQKSNNKTLKVIRSVSANNRKYFLKLDKQKTEEEQEFFAKLKQQKEIDQEYLEQMNKLIEEHKVNELRYYALLLLGRKIDKEQALEILKARKAK